MKVIHHPKHGDFFDLSDEVYPAKLEIVTESVCRPNDLSTEYGYVLKGKARIDSSGLVVGIEAGGYFCLPVCYELVVDGIVVIIRKFGFRGMFCVGRIENIGRLSYIDGCSDSIMVMPPRLGDPVLNYLHFPENVNQTQHTHPTYRLGIIAKGKGIAYSPKWTINLCEGAVFHLDAHELHSFRTTDTEGAMDVIAFHPDSDWGPTDTFHPMLSRTYIGNLR
jgi:quercetin dioxygenase-like cupin family protein